MSSFTPQILQSMVVGVDRVLGEAEDDGAEQAHRAARLSLDFSGDASAVAGEWLDASCGLDWEDALD